MGKNVAVFVDVANIFYAAKAAGVDIDYVTLLKSAVANRDFVRAYAYTGLDPENENQRNFHAFLARHGYKVVSKDIRKYGDGKVKANLDIELVVDMMKTARNLDVAIVVSGDGDFAPAIRAVQEMGVRVEVISFRGNTSSDLIDVADIFTDITQIARVDRESSRSGRRVAGDEEDLSMTEVPDKQTEGTGRGRGRGRGRGGRTAETGRVAAGTRGGRTAAQATQVAAAPEAEHGEASPELVVLPGEKLSRAAQARAAAAAARAAESAGEGPAEELEEESIAEGAEPGAEGEEGLEGARRRRRRGGRGRGRGRGREAGEPAEETYAAGGAGRFDEEPLPAAPRGPQPTPFGSVWDSQLGVPPRQIQNLTPLPEDEEEYAEPEIPEYLLAERRQSRGRGGRGRGGYAAAIERERFGSRGGSGLTRYGDAGTRGGHAQGGGGGRSRRDERPAPSRQRPERVERPAVPAQARGGDPWSEVPPELEEMLRSQLAGKLGRPAAGTSEAAGPEAAPSAAGTPARRGRRPAARSATVTDVPVEAPAVEATAPVSEAVAPRRRAPARRRTAAADAGAGDSAAVSAQPVAPPAAETAAAPARRTRARRGPAPEGVSATDGASAATEATEASTKRRAPARRRTATAEAGDGQAPSVEAATDAVAPAPRRRTTRRATPAAD